MRAEYWTPAEVLRRGAGPGDAPVEVVLEAQALVVDDLAAQVDGAVRRSGDPDPAKSTACRPFLPPS